MSVSLNELYSRVSHNDMKLIAGKGGMHQRVRWIHMVESIEISDFLEGQEIAFTTGVGLGNAGELLELVDGIYHHGASGVVVNVGPYINAIPDEVVAFCDERDLPLFCVPWRVHMAKIMHDFSKMIAESEAVRIELAMAMKNAVLFPGQEELYAKHIIQNGYRTDSQYCLAVFHFCVKDSEQPLPDARRKGLGERLENFQNPYYQNIHYFKIDRYLAMAVVGLDEKKVVQGAEAAIRQITPFLEGAEECYAGVGQQVDNIGRLYQSYRQAVASLNLSLRLGRVDEATPYRGLGFYKLLLSVGDSEVLDEFYAESLGPLQIYDDANHSDYCQVLASYLNCGCSVQETAAQLFVHRNTVNYKVNKIEEILGCDLTVLKTRLRLSVAMMIKQIQ